MSQNSTLSYGLNISKRQHPPPLPKKSRLQQPPQNPPQRPQPSNPDPSETSSQAQPQAERNLSTLLTARNQHRAASTLDPHLYDYDSVYDAMHTGTSTSTTSTTDTPETKPRYMTSLLHAASIRKRDAQRAKEKVLARERAAEGDAFADKDADVGRFVTGAYQAAIAEAAREEEAERMREEDERRRRKRLGLGAGGTGGMGGLYRGLLEREDVRVAGAMGRVDALIHGGGVGDTGVEPGEQEQVGVEEEEKKKEEVIRNGVAVNEDGQVVDKRDLLTAGLNIKSKPKLKGSSGAGNTGALHSSAGSNGVGYSAGRHAARERQSRMLASQLDAANKRVADEAALEYEAVQRAAKSKKTGAEISGARERYLERKKQKQTQVVEGMEDETI